MGAVVIKVAAWLHTDKTALSIKLLILSLVLVLTLLDDAAQLRGKV